MGQAASSIVQDAVSPARSRGPRGQWLRVLRWIAAIGFALIAVWSVTRVPDTLLERSTRIGPADLWCIGWVSENEILGVSPTGAILLDANTGKRTPLSGLTAVVRSTAALIPPFQKRSFLSPDGKWLLYASDSVNPPARSTVCAVRLDGSDMRMWTNLPMFPDHFLLAWSADSRHWFRFRRSPARLNTVAEQFEYSLDDPHAMPRRAALTAQFTPSVCLAGNHVAERIASGEKVLDTTHRRLGLRMIDLQSPASRPPPLIVTFPEAVDACRVPLQSRSRIVLDTALRFRSSGSRFEGFLSALNGNNRTVLHTVWVCDASGTNLKEVGHVRRRNVQSLGDQFGLFGCSPSGQRLLFICGESLYVTDLP